MILAIYVDDILLFTNDQEKEKLIVEELSKRFKMKYMGKAASILGIRIMFEDLSGQISIDQTQYIKSILKRFNMTECNSVITPLELGQGISKEMEPKTEEEKEIMNKIPYREAIGSLLFLTLTTRPDISYAVNLLSRYCENPGPKHWGAIERIFRYLKGTMDLKLRYGGTEETITGYGF